MGLCLIRRVTGLFPFGPRESGNMKSLIENGLFMWDGPFSRLSWNCRDLICHLLMVDPMKRYSAEEALNHPWFRSDEESAVDIRSSKDLAIHDLQAITSSKSTNGELVITVDSYKMVTSTNAVYIILRETGRTGRKM